MSGATDWTKMSGGRGGSGEVSRTGGGTRLSSCVTGMLGSCSVGIEQVAAGDLISSVWGPPDELGTGLGKRSGDLLGSNGCRECASGDRGG